MNKVNYLALGAVALAVIAVFLPWVQVTPAVDPSEIEAGVQPITISGVAIGYGLFGMLVALLGGFLSYKEFKWTFMVGIVNFIDGYGYLHAWFGASSHDSGNYGDVTSKSSVDPKFGLYLFIVASLAFLIFTLKYYKSKKAETVSPAQPRQNENQQATFTPKATVASQVYQPSKIKTMTTESSETPTGAVPSETPKAPVQAAETAAEQPAATPTAAEPEVETPTVAEKPAEAPQAPVQAPVAEPAAPVYQAPRTAAAPQQPVAEPETKKLSTSKILLIVLAIVVVCAGVFVTMNKSSQQSKDKTEQGVTDEKARLQIIINEVNQAVSDKKYDDALLKINSINWLYEPGANKDYVDQYNSQRENLRNTVEQLKANQEQEDQQQANEKAAAAAQQQPVSTDTIK